MTQDFFLGQLRLLLVAVLSYATGKGWLTTADSSLAASILTPLGLLLGPWIWSLYVNVGKKLVPKDSVAIAPHTPMDAAAPKGTSAAGTVVGALLFALLLPFVLADPASAQIKLTGNPKADFSNLAPKPASDATASVDNLGTQLSKVAKAVVDKAIIDVQAASDDADKHNDAISKPCWQAQLAFLKALPTQWDNPPAEIGIALGIQIQRDLITSITGSDAGSLKVACAALLGDQLKIVANIGALLGIRIATGGLF